MAICVVNIWRSFETVDGRGIRVQPGRGFIGLSMFRWSQCPLTRYRTTPDDNGRRSNSSISNTSTRQGYRLCKGLVFHQHNLPLHKALCDGFLTHRWFDVNPMGILTTLVNVGLDFRGERSINEKPHTMPRTIRSLKDSVRLFSLNEYSSFKVPP